VLADVFPECRGTNLNNRPAKARIMYLVAVRTNVVLLALFWPISLVSLVG